MQIFEVRGEREGTRVRIRAIGELDLATAPRLRACVDEHVNWSPQAVELDLREVGFVDSTGVRLLLKLQAEGQQDGWTLELLCSEPVRRIISLLGLQSILCEREPDAPAVREAVGA